MTKKSAGSARGAKVDGWKDRIHWVALTYGEEVDVKEWYGKTVYGWSTALQELVDDGWSVKITPDEDLVSYYCSVTCKVPKLPHTGHTWTFRYRDYEVGIMVVFWYLKVRWEGEPMIVPTSNAEEDWLGLGQT